MSRGRPGLGARSAVAAAVGLLVASLVAVPAYISSVGSAALAIQLDESCVSDLGIGSGFSDAATLARLNSYLPELDAVEEPEIGRTTFASVSATGEVDAVATTTAMHARPGQFDQLGVAPPRPGEVLVPEWATADGAFQPGTEIDLSFGFSEFDGEDAPTATLSVGGTYPTIPTRPEPEFWCSYSEQIRPNSRGDRPPPMLLTVSETFDALPDSTWFGVWSLTPDKDGLRRDQAAALTMGLESVVDREFEIRDPEFGRRQPIDLEVPLRRSGQVADFVALSIAPLRYAAVVASLALLAGAAVLAARSQVRELRLRALRGLGPVSIAWSQARWLVSATVVGAVGGALAGLSAVRVGGPSPYLEPAAIRAGLLTGALGWIGATVAVAGVIGVVGVATVDRRSRSVVSPRVVVEIGLVALAIWSFVRLDEFGGVRQIGVEVRGGDVVAQAFPLLGAIALVVIIARPIEWLVRRGRRVGSGLPTSIFLGWRRVTSEPRISTAMMLSAAVAVAIAFQASLLTQSVDRLLSDKAEMIVGADLSIRVLGPPPTIEGLGAAATQVVQARTDDRSIRLLGVDPDVFEDVAYWRSDASAVSLEEMMARLAAGDADRVATILVDPGDTLDDVPELFSFDGEDRPVTVVATASFFPGYKNGSPMLVIDRSIIDGRGDREIWVRDPVIDAADRLRDAGGRVTGDFTPDEVFSNTSFLSARWSYDTLTVLAVVVGIVTLLAQLLVLEARQRSRRVTMVLTRPMGLTTSGDRLAVGVEVGLPLVMGGVVGAAIGWLVARLALGRLDSLRTLQPPAVLVTHFSTLLVAAGSIAVATVGLAALGAARASKTDAGEVMRVVER